MSLLLRSGSRPLQAWQILSLIALLGCGSWAYADTPADFEIQTSAGEPFGVAKVKIFAPRGAKELLPADGDFQISEKNGRVLYPAYVAQGDATLVYFLFRGKEPLDVTVRLGKSYQATLEPKPTSYEHKKLTEEWFNTFVRRNSLSSPDEAEVSPLVDNYLAAMLARRMKLNYNPPGSGWFGRDPLNEGLAILLGTESIRMAMAKDTMLRPRDTVEPANQPLPRALVPPALELPAEGRDVKIEPMARHVPHECFYVRFGSFENFTWFRSTIDEWGGDLRNLTAIRGIDYQNSARIERQLLLKETALSKIFGPQVIADVAIVGHDTFVREGSSLGFIFQAKNNLMLATSFVQQRAEALKQPGVTEEKVKIAEHEVSFISTPDNRVRSFYAVDGDFYLVTNSRTLVQRFYEAGRGEHALSEAHEFRYARTLMPLSRNDAAFVYLSDEFFRALVGPKYRVEMTRRMQALTELDLIRLAQLAAKTEGQPGDTIEQLIAANLLPPKFGLRSDGSRPVRDGDVFVDSMRGSRGAFLPVADVPIEKVTAAESEAYRQFSDAYTGNWKRIDPVMIGIQHRPGEEAKRERITLDIHIAPYSKQVWAYSLLRMYLGPPTRSAVAPVPGDIASLQVADLRNIWRAPTGHLFAGMRDYAPEFTIANRHVNPHGTDHGFGDMPGYAGATPPDDMMHWLFGGEELKEDGYSQRGARGEWYRRLGDFGIASRSKELLEEIGPKLRTIDAERPAQLRLHIGDLSQAKLSELVKAEAFLRADQSSRGNTRFLHNLALELKIPPDKCLAAAEDLLDGKLVCPLNGKYELRETEPGLPKWTSTRWITIRDGEKLDLPAGYVPPPLTWFRGLDLEFSIDDTSISMHAEVNVERR